MADDILMCLDKASTKTGNGKEAVSKEAQSTLRAARIIEASLNSKIIAVTRDSYREGLNLTANGKLFNKFIEKLPKATKEFIIEKGYDSIAAILKGVSSEIGQTAGMVDQDFGAKIIEGGISSDQAYENIKKLKEGISPLIEAINIINDGFLNPEYAAGVGGADSLFADYYKFKKEIESLDSLMKEQLKILRNLEESEEKNQLTLEILETKKALKELKKSLENYGKWVDNLTK